MNYYRTGKKTMSIGNQVAENGEMNNQKTGGMRCR
jgi:hypothetical protein